MDEGVTCLPWLMEGLSGRMGGFLELKVRAGRGGRCVVEE